MHERGSYQFFLQLSKVSQSSEKAQKSISISKIFSARQGKSELGAACFHRARTLSILSIRPEMPRPIAVRLLGIDVSFGGPPLASDISRLLTSPDASTAARPPARSGLRRSTLRRVVGGGNTQFARAAKALETADALDLPWARFWRGGRGSRWGVGDPVVVGARVMFPGLWVANVNRVVGVQRGRGRVCVAWATTARHCLVGEEVVEVRKEGNDVVFELESWSRPRGAVAWAMYPYVIYLQRKFARSVAWRIEQIARGAG